MPKILEGAEARMVCVRVFVVKMANLPAKFKSWCFYQGSLNMDAILLEPLYED